MNDNLRPTTLRLTQELGFVASAPAPLPPLQTGPRPVAARAASRPAHRHYLTVTSKFGIALACAFVWATLSLIAGRVWIEQLSEVVGAPLAWLTIVGIAILPGFMNAFLVTSLLLDRRPAIRKPPTGLPGITILVAAYNEADNITATIDSIANQNYPGPLQVIVINDGSTDATAATLAAINHPWLQVINLEKNAGKANALNAGLAMALFRLTITLDGDSYLHHDALRNLVGRYLSDPPNTKAVAGAVLVRNSRKNLVTRAQEWDYFHGIASVKRLQSLYQGTLVAQGAFSIYETATLRAIGGWSDTVGEDIVLTWAMLERGHRVGFAENACAFTNVPENWGQFIKQRQRWSRGLIEAFKAHWRLLFKPRMTTLFIVWNLMFPYMDLVFTFAFLPGLVLALFGVYWIAGPMTLLVLPLAFLINFIMYRIQSSMFFEQGLRVRDNASGFFFYSLLYSMVLQPACVVGYVKEIFNHTKSWGTK